MLVLGAIGFGLVASWLATNLVRFNSHNGWATCTNTEYVKREVLEPHNSEIERRRTGAEFHAFLRAST